MISWILLEIFLEEALMITKFESFMHKLCSVVQFIIELLCMMCIVIFSLIIGGTYVSIQGIKDLWRAFKWRLL